MIMDNLFDIILFSISAKLTKVIHQWSHAGGQVQYTIHKLTKRNLACVKNEILRSTCKNNAVSAM